MTENLNDHDWEVLSAYMDGRLSSPEESLLENRLQNDPELATAFRSLVRTRAILREIPRARRRRSYVLSQDMVRKVGWLRLIPTLNFSSAAAAILAVLLFIMDIFPPAAVMNWASAPLAAVPAVQDSAARPAAEAKAPEELAINLTSTPEESTLQIQNGELEADQASPQATQSTGMEMLIIPSPENAEMAPAAPAPENPQVFTEPLPPDQGPVGLTAPSMKAAPAEPGGAASEALENQYAQAVTPTVSGMVETAAQAEDLPLEKDVSPATVPEIESSIAPTSPVEENRVKPSPEKAMIPATQIPAGGIDTAFTEIPLEEPVADNNLPSGGVANPAGSPTRITNIPDEKVDSIPLSGIEFLVKAGWISLMAVSLILAFLSAVLKKKSLL